jgi:hypothetical protein
MQINNMRDYYEREAEMKEHTLRLKDQEIAALKAEVEALRSGRNPEDVPRANIIQAAAKSEPVQRESP